MCAVGYLEVTSTAHYLLGTIKKGEKKKNFNFQSCTSHAGGIQGDQANDFLAVYLEEGRLSFSGVSRLKSALFVI